MQHVRATVVSHVPTSTQRWLLVRWIDDGPRAPNPGPAFHPLPPRRAWHPRLTLALALALTLACQAAVASDPIPPPPPSTDLASLSLEELMDIEVPNVVAASRYLQKITDAPASVSLRTSRDNRLLGHRHLADALAGLPGTYLTYDRNYHYLGYRGFQRPGDYLGRFLLLVDDHRVNENIFGGTGIGHDALLDFDLIERLEFIPGPSSSLYGNNAFLGVIHLTPRRGADVQGVEATAAAGSFDTYTTRLTWGQAWDNGLDVLLSASLYDSDGDTSITFDDFQRPSPSPAIARHMDDENAVRLYGSATFHDLRITAAWNHRDKTVPTASFGTRFNDPQYTTHDERGYVDAAYDLELSDAGHLRARVFYDHYHYNGTYPYEVPGAPDDRVINQDKASGRWLGSEVHFTQTLAERHTLIAGGEFRHNLRQSQQNFDEHPPVTYVDVNSTGDEAGLFAQADLQLWPFLELNAGLRFDSFGSGDEALSPRAALIGHLSDLSRLKAIYGRAFRAPNAFESHYRDPEVHKPGGPLDPETIDTLELAWEQQLARHHRLRLSTYLYEVRDLITLTEDPADGLHYFANLDRARATGLELSWDASWESGLTARASYAYQRAESLDTHHSLSHSPEHLAKTQIILPLRRDRFFAGFESFYQSQSWNTHRVASDDFVVFNLTLYGIDLLPGLDASASVYNLFDADITHPAGAEHDLSVIPQNGRTFRIKLTYRF